jgi:hypothetical protein
MGEFSIKFKGIVDKVKNPFSTPSWSKEHPSNGELGSGKSMQRTAIENFQKVLDKGGWLENIVEPHREKYATFQAIRWGYAIVEGNKVVPTPEWNEISSKSGYIPTGRRKLTRIKKTSNAISSEQKLIEQLKNFKLKPAVSNYLDNTNLKLKNPNEILRKFTFDKSISRAFHYESPSIQYEKWASTMDAYQIIRKLEKVKKQSDYDELLFKIANSLKNSWKVKNEKGQTSKMNIGIALKIINLLMKHLVYVNLKERKDLIRFLHVPWDKFTLQPLKNIWLGTPRIVSNSSQGFVKSKEQYIELHNFITTLTNKTGVKRIIYEFWAWDSKH